MEIAEEESRQWEGRSWKARDAAKESTGMETEVKEKAVSAAENNCQWFGTVKGVMDEYLGKCGMRWVAMDTLIRKLGFGM